jgi:hypothetical protein
MTTKVKILTSEYNENKDLIFWTLKEIENNKEQTYCWPRTDYLKYIVGLSDKTISKVSNDLLSKHCLDMIGKEINFEVQGDFKVDPRIDENKKVEIESQIEKTKEEVNHFCETVNSISKKSKNVEVF